MSRQFNIAIGRVNRTKHYCINIRIDRGTPLGNPFYMSNESQRDIVCDKYIVWFNKQVKDKQSKQYKELTRIYWLALGNNINLQCWCTPKRCHGETIKTFLDKYLNK